jgi:hypothetical protein
MKTIHLLPGNGIHARALAAVFCALLFVRCMSVPTPREKTAEEVVDLVARELVIIEKNHLDPLVTGLDGLRLGQYHEVLFGAAPGALKKTSDVLIEMSYAEGLSISDKTTLARLSDELARQTHSESSQSFDKAVRALYCFSYHVVLEAKISSLQKSKRSLQTSELAKRIIDAPGFLRDADQRIAIATLLDNYILLCFGENDQTVSTLLEQARPDFWGATQRSKAKLRDDLDTTLVDYWTVRPETHTDYQTLLHQRGEDIADTILRGEFDAARKRTLFLLEKQSALGELSAEDVKILANTREDVKKGKLILTAKDKAILKLLARRRLVDAVGNKTRNKP